MDTVGCLQSRVKPRLLVCTILLQLFKWTSPASIDEIITQAAESSSQFGLLYGPSGDVLVELDVILTPQQWEEVLLYQAGHTRHGRKAIRGSRYRWTGKTIPYEFQSGAFSNNDRKAIQKALDHWEEHTCIRFRPASAFDRNKIRFQNGGGCSSYVGMIGETQPVILGRGCRSTKVVVHELGHAVGFQHEQTRPDRDAYVSILSQNIPSNLLYNFNRYPLTAVNTYDVPYDYQSIMHYSSKAFSVNGLPTIIAKDQRYQDLMGQATALSFRDIKLANIMYSCADNCPKKNCPDIGFQGQDCRCYCPGNPVKQCPEESVVTSRTTTRRTAKTTTTTTTTTARPSTSRPVSECKDTHARCRFWKSRGECTRNKGYMGYFCRRTCDFCGDGDRSLVCEDLNQNCRYWSVNGYCSNRLYLGYMRNNCPKACGVCRDVKTTTPSENGLRSDAKQPKIDRVVSKDCVDKTSRCQMWAELGYCDRTKAYMKRQCKKTCNMC